VSKYGMAVMDVEMEPHYISDEPEVGSNNICTYHQDGALSVYQILDSHRFGGCH
jgi:hypothetical protein